MADRAVPNLPSRAFDATADFYRGFGFEEAYRDDGWMILTRGSLALEFFLAPENDPYSSGYMANTGILTSLLRAGDCVFEDRLNHASLLDGGLHSGARFQRFPHNDVDALRRKLAVAGGPSLVMAFVVAVIANVLGDAVWFWAGRLYGGRVMGLLCRFSLSPDSCVRQSESLIARWGGSSLVAAKFVPGVSVVAAPMAGANSNGSRGG